MYIFFTVKDLKLSTPPTTNVCFKQRNQFLFFISRLTKPHPSSQREPCQPKCSPFIASFRTKLKPSLCACTFGPSCRDSPPLQVRAGLPACLPSVLFPLGKPSQRHREQCRAYLIVYLRNITQVADRRCGWKITGTMEPWRARKRFCTSIMLSNKITNQSLVNRGCFFFLSPSSLKCSFCLFDAALEIFRFGAKWNKMAGEAALIPLHSEVVAAARLQ